MKTRSDSYRPAVLILIPLLLILTILFLFRGWREQGMEMDEVSKVIGVIPLINERALPLEQAIFKTTLFGVTVPVMFKEYISSAYLIRFLPLYFFDDYLFGLRLLHLLYFCLGTLAFYLFAQRFSLYTAFWASLLLVTSPLLYPEVRIGFVTTSHLLFLTVAAWLLYRFIQGSGGKLALFGGTFLTFFAANQSFYVIWVVLGVSLASLLLYPDYWKRLLRISNLLVAIPAALLGMINFVYYNAANGYPTLLKAYEFLFDPEAYNQAPIDFSPAQPFLKDFSNRLIHLNYFLSPRSEFHLLAAVATVAVLVIGLWKTGRSGQWRQDRILFFPFAAFLFIFLLILLSPKGTRPGHYAYLFPFWQLATISAIVLAARWSSPGRRRRVLVAVPACLTLLNLFGANHSVIEANRSGGTVLFTPAVFDFNDYIQERGIDSRSIYFLMWGLHAQSYFLNHGDFQINQIVYSLYSKPEEEQRAILKGFFQSPEAWPRSGDCLYFPLFARKWPETRNALLSLADAYGGDLRIEKTFDERNGTPAILLYRLDNALEFSRAFAREVLAQPWEERLSVQKFGPQPIEAGRADDLAMWFIADDLAPTTKVTFDGWILRTIFSGDHCTALVPARGLVRQSGSYRLQLYDPVRRVKSQSLLLQVNPRAVE